MTLLSFSLSHHTAPVGAREAAVSVLGDAGHWLATVPSHPAVAEALVVSTCHRLEFYLVADEAAAARNAVSRACGLRQGELEHGLLGWTARQDVHAAIHLARVAAGLDSLIVGEAEIAGQIRRAAALARDAGALGPRLESVLAGALRASGRARSETRISQGVTSAASAGVALAASILGTFENRHVLVIGSGQVARTAIGRLARRSVGRISVASRSRHHAEEAAAPVSATVLGLEDVVPALPNVDAIIAATFAGGFVVTSGQCGEAFALEPSRRRVIVDLSVPRVIEPSLAPLDHVTLVSVDDLGDVAGQAARRRQQEIPLADAIAVKEGERAFARMRARRASR